MAEVFRDNSLHTLLQERSQTAYESAPSAYPIVPRNGHDIYNPSAAVKVFFGDGRGEIFQFVREEAREDEQNTRCVLYHRDEWGLMVPVDGAKVYNGQDPRLSIVWDGRDNPQLFLSFVETVWSVTTTGSPTAQWRQAFYSGSSPNNLRFLTHGPWGMKNTIVVDSSPNDPLRFLTRFQGEKGGAGRLGACKINRLRDLTAETLASSPLIDWVIPEGEWVGGNTASIQKVYGRELITAICHQARCLEDQSKEYVAIKCIFDVTKEDFPQIVGKPIVLATVADYLPGPVKRADLKQVVYPGEVTETETEYGHVTTVLAGARDATISVAKIIHPHPPIIVS